MPAHFFARGRVGGAEPHDALPCELTRLWLDQGQQRGASQQLEGSMQHEGVGLRDLRPGDHLGHELAEARHRARRRGLDGRSCSGCRRH